MARSALGSDLTRVADPTSGILIVVQPLTTWLAVTTKVPSPIAKPDPEDFASAQDDMNAAIANALNILTSQLARMTDS